MKPWSKEELEILKGAYPSKKKEAILKALPLRSWSAISKMAYLSKINRKEEIKLNLTDLEKGYLDALNKIRELNFRGVKNG